MCSTHSSLPYAQTSTRLITSARYVDRLLNAVLGSHKQQTEMREIFNQHRVTQDEFLKQDEVLESRHLYLRFRDRYFSWENGSPAMASLAIYRKTYLQNAAKATASQSSTWSRWWGRNNGMRSRTTTADSTVSVSTISAEANEALSHSSVRPESGLVRTESMPISASTPVLAPAKPDDLQRSETMPVLSSEADQKVSTIDNDVQEKTYAKTLRLTSEQLKELNLRKGVNRMSFTVQSSFSGVAIISARIFLWQAEHQVVISDIDGTITK